jgi:hypothetical protein
MDYDLNVRQNYIEQKEARLIIPRRDLDSSEEEYHTEPPPEGCFEKVLHHLANSSVFIFPQGSYIRDLCQMCVEIEDDDDAAAKSSTKDDDNLSPEKSAVLSPRANSMADASPSPHGSLSKSARVGRSPAPLSMPVSDKKLAASVKAAKRPEGKTKKKVNIVAKIFEGIIMTLIIISSITLVIDRPISNPDSSIIVVVGYLDNCFTVYFTIEASIKIIALGFLATNTEMARKGFTAYMQNPWNILDFIVVVASLFDFIVTIQLSMAPSTPESGGGGIQDSLQSLKALRALRALRPLRMISRDPGMKLIVNALLKSIPSMGNVTIVCLLFVLIFAIMGVDFFKGTFHYCSLGGRDEGIADYNDCVDQGGEWMKVTENFDNVGKAMMTLVEMMTTEGWIDVMDNAIDGVAAKNGVEQSPLYNNNQGFAIFFILFMIVGSQFILNLFVGVVMDNFNKLKEQTEMGSSFVTEEQQSWVDAMRLGLSINLSKKIVPPAGWRRHVFDFCMNSVFENTIMFFIGANTVAMAVNYDGMPGSLSDALKNLNYFFAFVFNMEMIFKLIALEWQYFDSAWNQFDCLVVIGTDLGFVMNALGTGGSFSSATTVIRAFRIMRIIRLVRSQKSIKIILDTLLIILPQIRNFITLMFLLLFIFAALGMNQFGGVAETDFLNEKDNFKDLGNALLYLFRASTGEDWNKIMHDLTLEADGSGNCITDQDYETYRRNEKVPRACGSQFSIIYFFIFTILIAWLIINLAVAAVIEGLEQSETQNSGVFSGDDVQTLVEGWEEYDPKATGWIDIKDFVKLIVTLPPPFGSDELRAQCQHSEKRFHQIRMRVKGRSDVWLDEERRVVVQNKDVLRVLTSFKFHTYRAMPGMVHFKDVFMKLVKRKFQEEVKGFKVTKHLKNRLKGEFENKHVRSKVGKQHRAGFDAQQAYAANVLQRYAIRRFRNKERREKVVIDKKQFAKYSYAKGRKEDDPSEEQMLNRIAPENDMSSSDGLQLVDEFGQVVGGFRKNSSHGPGQPAKHRNTDENPQEFEEVGQSVSNPGRAPR